jgi:hypothetical protein
MKIIKTKLLTTHFLEISIKKCLIASGEDKNIPLGTDTQSVVITWSCCLEMVDEWMV